MQQTTHLCAFPAGQQGSLIDDIGELGAREPTCVPGNDDACLLLHGINPGISLCLHHLETTRVPEPC